MAVHRNRFGAKARMLALGMLLALVSASNAWGEGDQDRLALIAKVNPSVVKVVTEGGLGSGYVVDASGIIATNAHVVKHAKKVHVVFPADHDKKEYPSEGFLAVLPTKDMCLLRINPGSRKLRALPIAEKLPMQGETIYTFGAPLGLENTVSSGMVSSTRTGQEVSDLVAGMGAGKEYYQKVMGYDLDANWIQITAPISPGNSGGPLINIRGEVLGLNTWKYGGTQGENLNFSISALHLKKFIADTGKGTVQSWDKLPNWTGAGHDADNKDPGRGDAEKTLAAWKELNKALISLNKNIDECEKRLKKIPPPNLRNPLQGQTRRLKQKSDACEKMSAAYKEYAGKVKAVDTHSIDHKLITLTIQEFDVADHTGNSYHDLAMSMSTQADLGEGYWEAKLISLKEATSELRRHRDILRVELTHRYGLDFPTLEQTAKEPNGDPGSSRANNKTNDKKDSADDDYREWTSAGGKYSVKAKLVRVANGQVTLRRPNGKQITIDIDKLSEEDQEFIQHRASKRRSADDDNG
jgi:hypothetical protein